MRKIDKDGLIICKLQGDVFYNSIKYVKTSSEIFMRRFMLSDVAKEFDSLAILNDTLSIQDIYDLISEQFGNSSYGKIKYNQEVLYWIGYLYRYMSYICELSSLQVYKIIKPKELNELYYSYHTLDCKVVVERILEEKNLSFENSSLNSRLLKLLRKRKYEQEVLLIDNVSLESNLLKEDSKINYNGESINKKLAISYNDKLIGNIEYKDTMINYIEIWIKVDEKYQNKGMELVLLKKCLKEINKTIIKTEVSNDSFIEEIKKLGYEYYKEEDDYCYFIHK